MSDPLFLDRFTQALKDAVAAVCPVLGVSVGDPAQAYTWSFAPDPSATAAQVAAGQQAVSGFSYAPRRAAALSALLDPLSPAQRASIAADHKDRLQAEASEHAGGLLPIDNAKVIRAAADLGLTPDTWFKLAGA